MSTPACIGQVISSKQLDSIAPGGRIRMRVSSTRLTHLLILLFLAEVIAYAPAAGQQVMVAVEKELASVGSLNPGFVPVTTNTPATFGFGPFAKYASFDLFYGANASASPMIAQLKKEGLEARIALDLNRIEFLNRLIDPDTGSISSIGIGSDPLRPHPISPSLHPREPRLGLAPRLLHRFGEHRSRAGPQPGGVLRRVVDHQRLLGLGVSGRLDHPVEPALVMPIEARLHAAGLGCGLHVFPFNYIIPHGISVSARIPVLLSGTPKLFFTLFFESTLSELPTPRRTCPQDARRYTLHAHTGRSLAYRPPTYFRRQPVRRSDTLWPRRC